jgi:glycogen(starch) synthase
VIASAPRPSVVLMTTDTRSGVWPYALALAAGLAQAGTRTVLASLGPAPDATLRAEALAVPGLILEVPPEVRDELGRAGDWLLRLERRHAPDVVHLNGHAQAALPWRAPSVLAAHLCLPSRWRAVNGGRPPQSCNQYARAVARDLAAAGVVVAPTAARLREIEAIYGWRAGRVIHNGIDAIPFLRLPERELIFSTGRVWDDAENVRALDAVAARLPWPVVVAGDWRPPDGSGEPPSHLLCLDLPERAQVRDWLAEAPIYAAPARHEPFGLGVLEAALAGCALVLGDIPSLRELWSDAALFVAPDDHDDLAATLADLIERPWLRAEFGRAARVRGLGYSLPRMTEGYLDAYADAAAGRSVANKPAAWPTAAAN